MQQRADDVFAGLQAAARTVGAHEAVVYLKRSFDAATGALQEALDRTDLDGLDVRLVHGPDTYVAGEETAAIEFLAGRRAWPRPKPPLPSGVGLSGRPTLVQNVETLARVPAALADPVTFRRRESTLVSLWGHVRRPGVYEVALGTSLRRVIDEFGQGPTDGVGLVFPAGACAAPLGPAQLDTPLDPGALEATGSALGAAALLVVRADTCLLAVAASLAAFFERTACGQCPPCCVGSSSLARILTAAADGSARVSDLAAFDDVAGFMRAHGYCAHSPTAAAVLPGLLRAIPEELSAHLEGGGCPRDAERCAPFDFQSPERLAIEGALT